jgi:hypothetical protein
MTKKRAGWSNLNLAVRRGTAPLVNFRLAGSVSAELDAAAARRGITRSEAIRRALADWLAADKAVSA